MEEVGCFSDGDLLIFLSHLIASFGLREPFESASARENFACGNLGMVILELKHHFRLSCRLKIVYVEGNIDLYFARSNLVGNSVREKCLEDLKEGKRGSMCVIQPAFVPPFFSGEFSRTVFLLGIDMTIYRKQSFEVFARSLSHELSHIVLNCVRHPLRNIEAAADLTSMILGFHEVYIRGFRHDDFLAGYLTEPQVSLVYNEINRLLKQR